MSKYKYLNFFNNELIYSNLGETCENEKNIALWSIPKEAKKIDLDKNNKNVFTFSLSNQYYSFFIVNLLDSGIKNNNLKKRVIISKKKSVTDIKTEVILIYFAGNKKCFIRPKNNKQFFFKSNIKNKSVWIDFSLIFLCLNENKNLKYRTNQNELYFSQNINEVIKIDDKKFKEISKNEISEIENKIFSKTNNNYIDMNPFEIKNKSLLSNSTEIGILAEKIFNDLITDTKNIKKKTWIEERLNCKIKKIFWNNEKEESFLPYDFMINENIFIEIKGTEKSNESFILTGNEWEFKENKKNNYFLVNITNVSSKKYEIKIYNWNELQKINFIKSEKYIYNNKKEENNE